MQTYIESYKWIFELQKFDLLFKKDKYTAAKTT